MVEKGFKKTEIGLIPEDWEVKNIISFAKIITGGTPPTNDKSNYGDEYFFVSPSDLGNGRIIQFTEKKLSKKGFNISRKFPKDSVLFTCIGSTIGKLGIADRELTSNQQINAVLPNDSFNSVYLYYILFLNTNKIKQIAGQTALPIINKTQFGELSIPLPPKPEQEAIAKVLSDTDTLIEKLEQLIAKKRLIKQGAMQQLLKPKKGWEVKKLGEVAVIEKGEQLNRQTLSEKDTYPVFNGGITPSGYTDKWNTEKDTIIISEGGNSCGFVNFIKERFWRGGHCYQVVSKIKKMFLFYLLKSFEREIMSLRVGSGLPNIQRNRLLSFEIPIPKDKSEQTRIAQILTDMDNEIEALERQLAKYKLLKQGMMQVLLTGKIRLVKPVKARHTLSHQHVEKNG